MKIVLSGSLGNISKPLIQELINKGHSVTVISSNPARKNDIEVMGARAAIGSLEDVSFLSNIFTGADAAYCMVPPGPYFTRDIEPLAFYKTIAGNYAQAILRSGIRHVVQLSSIGAHLEKNSGFIVGHHAAENIFRELPAEISVTHLRPAAFYNNLFAFVQAIKHTGAIASNYGEEDRVVWVSPLDIAAVAAEELDTPGTGRKVRYVASEESTCNTTAQILGEAMGKPDLQWKMIPDQQILDILKKAGMPPQSAKGLVEMNACIHRGELLEDYFLNQPVKMGKVKLRDFAKEFAAAYNA